MNPTLSIFSVVMAASIFVGCQQNPAPSASNAASSSSAAPGKTATAKNSKPAVKVTSGKGTKAAPMPENQSVVVLKAINADPKMAGHTISVGASRDTIMLNGNVKSAAQKQLAETIAKQKSKGYKVVNSLTVKSK